MHRESIMEKFRIGLDYHGVIDKDPKFYSKFSRGIVWSGNEIHIITGSPETQEIEDQLNFLGIYWTHFYSIQDDLISQGHIPNIQEGDNSLWFPDDVWDEAKGLYCSKNEINLHYDDTERYGEYFTTPFMLV